MPRSDYIINLPGFTVKNVVGGDPIIYELCHSRSKDCIYCGSFELRNKGVRVRRLHHEMIGFRRTQLEISFRRFHCTSCNRYFTERLPGILPYKRATEPLRRQVFEQHKQGISQLQMSRWLFVGKATVERWFHDYYIRANHELKERHCPTILGIDEHFFSKKDGYATTFCDLRKHKIFDVVLGKSEKALEPFLASLKGRDRVQVVCIDLSSSYRSIIKKYFPNAKIVSDRFHVVRLVQHYLIQTAITLEPNLKEHKGIIKYLRMHRDNLKDKQKQKLDDYLLKHPAVKAVYEHKEKWMSLLLKKQQTKKTVKPLIKNFLLLLEYLKQLPIQACKTLARTLEAWQEEIARMWRFTKSNGITEGFHRKMKLIQRRAYGFKNFENYRLRVRILCS